MSVNQGPLRFRSAARARCVRRPRATLAWLVLAACTVAACTVALAAPRPRTTSVRSTTAAPRASAPTRPATPSAVEPDLSSDNGRVLVVRLEGPVSPVTAEALESAVNRAERSHYRALVIEIDTPGGLESSMRVMIKRLLASKVPVVTWVAPSGARAASAGVFVAMAGDVAAMAPGTNIGAATPINLQGPMDSTLARKATNDAAAFARTVAAQRGRSISWAEKAVRSAVAASETEAVELEVVDFVAATLPELLARADGRVFRRGEARTYVRVKGLPIDRIDPGFRQKLLAILAEPSVAYILLMLGFYGLMFELQNPGAILPGVVGGICLILAFFALSTLPVNYAGIALLLLAGVFFIAEIKVASHGMLAAGGILSMILGSLLLFRTDEARLPWMVIGGVTAITAAFFLLVVGAGIRAQRLAVRTGARGLTGRRAAVIERIAPTGMVRLDGELWRASAAEGAADVGSEVEVTGVDGLTLKVRPLSKEAGR